MTNETIRRVLPVREYVCPHCFNQIDECSCDVLPGHLVLIDEGVQEHVRILNEKGYATMFCCESHSVHQNLYIAFAPNEEALSALPAGFAFGRDNGWATVKFDIDAGLSDQEAEAMRQKALASLLSWCEALKKRKW